jgi:quinone-modifying oxidoreductase subunit QmoB
VKKRFPTDAPFTGLATDGLKDQIHELLYHPKVKVFTSTRIVKTEGQPGQFDVTLATSHGEMTDRVGAIVMATGWKPYDASKLGHLGYGDSVDVITNVEFEKMAAAGPIKRPSDSKPVVRCPCSSSALPATRSTCRTALRSAAWLPSNMPLTCASRTRTHGSMSSTRTSHARANEKFIVGAG